jgi:pimeloyl-ACP methyl ester carboxylesterase
MCRAFIILVALALAGCGRPQQKVAIGGHAVQLRLEGHGSPTVVFESGAGGLGLDNWTKVQAEVSKFASTVAYDRAGCGNSDPGPEPRDARRIAGELHEALGRVNARPPYVLVGHSSGAHYIRLFAHAYPEEVAGLVFVDPATEQIHDWFEKHVSEAMKAKADAAKMTVGARAEWQSRHVTVKQVRSARFPANLPVMVLSSTRSEPNHLPGFLEALLDSHRELAKQLPNVKHILTDQSGHNIPQEQPQLVAQAIQETVEQIRRIHLK